MSEKYLRQLHQAIIDEDNSKAFELIAKENMKHYINNHIGLGTCLHRACMKNNAAVCSALLEIGADTEAEESYGGTALHVASDKGHLACVKLLVQCGADVRAMGPQRFTAYDLAKHSGHKEVMEYLKRSMGDCNQNSTVFAASSCPIHPEEKQETSCENPDETDASPELSNTGVIDYGMGYQRLDQRLVKIQCKINQKIDGVSEQVQDVKQYQNQLKNDLTEIEERVKKLEKSSRSLSQSSKSVSRGNSLNIEAVEMIDRLRSNFCLFKDSIVAKEVMYCLYEKKVLNDNDLDTIDSITVNEEKTIKLLRLLLAKKDPTWIFALRDTLADSGLDYVKRLAEILETEHITAL